VQNDLKFCIHKVLNGMAASRPLKYCQLADYKTERAVN